MDGGAPRFLGGGEVSPFGAALIPLGIWEREEVRNEVFLSISEHGEDPPPPNKNPNTPNEPNQEGKGPLFALRALFPTAQPHVEPPRVSFHSFKPLFPLPPSQGSFIPQHCTVMSCSPIPGTNS